MTFYRTKLNYSRCQLIWASAFFSIGIDLISRQIFLVADAWFAQWIQRIQKFGLSKVWTHTFQRISIQYFTCGIMVPVAPSRTSLVVPLVSVGILSLMRVIGQGLYDKIWLWKPAALSIMSSVGFYKLLTSASEKMISLWHCDSVV